VSWPRELELGSWWQQRQEVGGAIPNWWWPKLGEERLEWELGAVMEAWAQQILERWYEAGFFLPLGTARYTAVTAGVR
jgi:hypothetical protein